MLNRFLGYENGTQQERKNDAELLQDTWATMRESIFTMHAEWYQNALFREGFHDIDIDMASGHAMYHDGQSGGLTFNVSNTLLQRQENVLLAINPRRKARAIRKGIADEAAADSTSAVLAAAAVLHNIDDMHNESVNQKVTYGCTVNYVAWDPNNGPLVMTEDGPAPAGIPILMVDSPFRWIWDPRATNYKQCLWAIRRVIQSEEWVRSTYPEESKKIDFNGFVSGKWGWLEQSLMEVSRSRIGYSGNRRLPHGRGQVVLYELFQKPIAGQDAKIIVMAGNHDSPQHFLASRPNIYGEIPAVLGNMHRVTGRLYGKSALNDFMDPQIALDKRERQIDKNCDLVSNPPFAKPQGATLDEEHTNEVGTIIEVPQGFTGQLGYLNPGQLPSQVFEQKNGAFQTLLFMSEPYGNMLARSENANSAVQLRVLAEREQALVSDIQKSEMNFWTETWRMYAKRFRKLAVYPREIGWTDADHEYNTRMISREDLPDDFVLELVEDPQLTLSKAATFAETMELGDRGFINMADNYERTRALKKIGRGDLVLDFKDQTLQIAKADRNLLKVRFAPEEWPIIPAVEDDPEIHLRKYKDFKLTTEYEAWAQRDVLGAARLDQMILWYEQMMAARLAQMQAFQMAQAEAQQGPMDPQEQKRQGRQAPQPARGSQGMAQSSRATGGSGQKRS